MNKVNKIKTFVNKVLVLDCADECTVHLSNIDSNHCTVYESNIESMNALSMS
jgi:hypothetical protein